MDISENKSRRSTENRKKSSPAVTILLSIIMGSLLITAMFSITLPYDYRAAGRILEASEIVEVEGGRTDFKGKFYVTSVVTERANIILYINHLLNPNSELIPLSMSSNTRFQCHSETGPDPYEVQLHESIYRAQALALRQMGYDIPLASEGVQIVHITSEENRETLMPGDIIIEAGGITIKDFKGLMKYLSMAAGKTERVPIVFIRNEKEEKGFIYPKITADNRMDPGIFFQNHLERRILPVKIFIRNYEFEGSSAGLPMFLEIIRQLSDEDIARGRQIACTGTLDESGRIQPVHGAGLKARGAADKGCSHFLCPEQNMDEAREASGNIEIIGVRDINDALERLKELE